MASFNPFKKEGPKKTPIGGFGERFQNAMKNNFRGVIGVLVPLVIIVPQLERFNNTLKLQHMWLTMLWFYLVQPVNVPITSLIPVFMLPMGGIMNSIASAKSYMNETVMLFILSGYLLVLLNNSGVDKRIAFWFIYSGDASQYNGKQMVFKCSSAAFFLSMFSNRLIVSQSLTTIMTNCYKKIATPPAKKSDDESVKAPDFTHIRHVVNNAIQTSAAIGGTAIVHSSTVNILFRGCYQELAPVTYEYPDLFNYLQYSAFAMPVAIVMFFCNLVYHMQLAGSASSGITAANDAALMKAIERENDLIPPDVSLHETFSVIAMMAYLLCVCFRFNQWMSGWAEYTADKAEPTIIGCQDATVAAIFVIVLHIIPKSFGFVKIWSAQKKKDLPPQKPESGILWWRFVDKNINYGYLFTYGSVFALLHAATLTELDHIIGLNIGRIITDKSWNAGIFIIILVAVILCNMMTPMASCSMWLPFVLLMSLDGAHPWPTHVYLATLGVGIASNFGFCIPFQYTPGYYTHNIGKVPVMTMVKYSIPSVIICSIILYLALILYAPLLWDPSGEGYMPLLPSSNVRFVKVKTTTPATGAGDDENKRF